jgi:hypothetical protein
MAQSAVSAIRTGCNMLSEGRADLEKFKKGAEQAVADAKAIYKEVTGLWGWVKGLLGVKPQKPNVVASNTSSTPVAKTQKQRHEPELTYEEYKAKSVHEIFENLKVYFETIRQLKAHCLELEAESSTTEHVADNALDLIEIRWQLNEMSTQVREAMSWTPEKLGLQDLFKQFLQTYDEIQEQQEFARQIERKKEREARWQRELSREIRIYKTAYVVAVLLAVLEVMGLYSALQENFGFGSWLLRLFFSH